MRYEDFIKDSLYFVDDDGIQNFEKGDVFWIEADDGSVCIVNKHGGRRICEQDIDDAFFDDISVRGNKLIHKA